jgi:hypothetical protein
MFSKSLQRCMFFLVISGHVSLSLAQMDMTSDGCADPAGFDSCWAAANNEATSLFTKCCTQSECRDSNNCYTPDTNCAQTTTCIAYALWIDCALSTCWNRVRDTILSRNYRCLTKHRFTDANTKNLAINAVDSCPIANHLAPYVPAPRATPGYCSCNMGFVYDVYLESNRAGAGEEYSCKNNVPGSQWDTCICCGDSSTVSTYVPLRSASIIVSIETWMHLLMNKQILQLLPLNRPFRPSLLRPPRLLHPRLTNLLLRPSLLRPPRLLHPRLTNLLLRPLQHRLHCASLQFHSLPRPNL